MKNISGALICGLLGFGIMGCENSKTETAVNEVTTQQPIAEVSTKPSQKLRVIAMVNSDTILNKYEYALFLRDELTVTTMKYEGTLRQMESKLRTDMDKLQREAPTLTQFEGQNRQQKLIRAQENLQLKQEEYSRKIMTIEQEYNRDIHNAINEFLERYCADKPYEMVLSNSDLGIIRWADKSLDITDEVLKGLNEEYVAKQAEEEKE